MIAKTAIAIGFVSLTVGIISRLKMTPLYVVRGGLEAQAILLFSMACFIIAITFLLLELVETKKEQFTASIKLYTALGGGWK